MSETRYLKAMWVGIEAQEPGPLTAKYGIYERKMIGVVIRSVRLRQCGHFMFGTVSIGGQKMSAGGAEDRIFPFHHVTLEPGAAPPRDMVPALGFCRNGNGYAFMYRGQPCTIEGAAVHGMDAGFVPVPDSEIPERWEVK